jgi:hypothetical protein
VEGKMPKRYYIDLSRNELATVSYFPGLELKKTRESEWVEDVLIPALLPVVRRKNKKISEVPITFWIYTRHTARSFPEEIFLFQTPAFPRVMIENTVKEALQPLKQGMIFAGKEGIVDGAVAACQIFRNKLIRFYFGKEEFEVHYAAGLKWNGNGPEFTPSYVIHSEIFLENRDSEFLFMRANINNNIITGESDRKFQQALNCIGIEE